MHIWYKNSYWDHFENFGMKWLGITLLFLAPLSLYERFINKVSPETQLAILIPLQISSILLVLYIMKRKGQIGWNKKVEAEIMNGKAKILKIKTEKSIKRKETYDLGSGFYLKISENKTLYLQGQHFDQLQYSRKLPNTNFELIKTSLMQNAILDIKTFGEYLKPEKKLKAFTSEQYAKGAIHYDGDLINISIDELT